MSVERAHETLHPPADVFRPRAQGPAAPKAVVAPGRRREIVRRLGQNRLAVAGFWIIVALVFMAIIGPSLVPYAYDEQNLLEANEPPSGRHWFGTDDFGRDVFARTWTGARISLFVGFTAAFLDLVVGVV
ncbi:MAG: ABC transporter permease, partial [bacterium]